MDDYRTLRFGLDCLWVLASLQIVRKETKWVYKDWKYRESGKYGRDIMKFHSNLDGIGHHVHFFGIISGMSTYLMYKVLSHKS